MPSGGGGDFFPVRYLYFFVLIVLALPFVLTVKHTTQTSMPPARLEPAIPAIEQLQNLALDRSTGWIR
jgi:hypothetical protein